MAAALITASAIGAPQGAASDGMRSDGGQPQIGAQVFIEPGQSPERIDRWFALLEQEHMSVCRIRLFESHLRDGDGAWDFALYDRAFEAARRHGIRVFATLFPAAANDDVGGFKLPRSDAHLAAIAGYVEHVVDHYAGHPALYQWVLMNEPGLARAPLDEPLPRRHFEEWVAAHRSAPQPGGYRQDDFPEQGFLRDEITWYLAWLAREVRKHDPQNPLHVNSHAIFDLLPEYDFAAWRPFLTTLGASMHPSWHFSDFERRQYALAVSANNDIVRAGAGPLPYWVTELQGGNNIFSGVHPLCPTKEEISQWLWTSIGAGARGIIFWTLNARATGPEAGEWGMLTYQDRPTDRLEAAGDVASVLASHPVFASARPLDTPITLATTPESSWTQSSFVEQFGTQHDALAGRRERATILSLLAFYEALQEQGVPARIADLAQTLAETPDPSGKVLILADQIAVPSRLVAPLESFVRGGGLLIATGLTGFFDEHRHQVTQTTFPLDGVFGAQVQEYRHVGDLFLIPLRDPPLDLPAHGWRATLLLEKARAVSAASDPPLAVRNRVGAGTAIWVPSPVGLAAWHRNNAPLAQFLRHEIADRIAQLPFVFESQVRHALSRTLRTASGYVTITANKAEGPQTIRWAVPPGCRPQVLSRWQEGSTVGEGQVTVMPEDTLVTAWACEPAPRTE
jgi:beta-galactosidase